MDSFNKGFVDTMETQQSNLICDQSNLEKIEETVKVVKRNSTKSKRSSLIVPSNPHCERRKSVSFDERPAVVITNTTDTLLRNEPHEENVEENISHESLLSRKL